MGSSSSRPSALLSLDFRAGTSEKQYIRYAFFVHNSSELLLLFFVSFFRMLQLFILKLKFIDIFMVFHSTQCNVLETFRSWKPSQGWPLYCWSQVSIDCGARDVNTSRKIQRFFKWKVNLFGAALEQFSFEWTELTTRALLRKWTSLSDATNSN